MSKLKLNYQHLGSKSITRDIVIDPKEKRVLLNKIIKDIMPWGISEIYIAYKSIDRTTLGSFDLLKPINIKKNLNDYFYMVMIEHFKKELDLKSKEIRGYIKINLNTIPFTFEEKFSNYVAVFTKSLNSLLKHTEISEKKGLLEL